MVKNLFAGIQHEQSLTLPLFLMQVENPEVQVSPVPRGHTRPQYIPLSPQTPDTDAVVLYPDGCEDRVSLAGRSVHMSFSITHSTYMVRQDGQLSIFGHCGERIVKPSAITF